LGDRFPDLKKALNDTLIPLFLLQLAILSPEIRSETLQNFKLEATGKKKTTKRPAATAKAKASGATPKSASSHEKARVAMMETNINSVICPVSMQCRKKSEG